MKLTVALAGNPNAGKTTIFNNLTGSNQRTGNYPGVTVEKRIGQAKYYDNVFDIVDLPGTYSLSATAEDELVARNFILQEHPDVIINVIDASNMYRNLYLTLQLLELEKPLILALNMVDTAKEQGIDVQINRLKLHFPNVRVHTLIGSKNIGTKELLASLTEPLKICPLKLTYGTEVESAVDKVLSILSPIDIPNNFPRRWLALRLLENDVALCSMPGLPCMSLTMHEQIDVIRNKLKTVLNEDVALYLAGKKYEYINHILEETVFVSDNPQINISDKIDEVLTHKYLGLPIFLFFMWLLFNMVFTLGKYPQNWLEDLFQIFGLYLQAVLPPGQLNHLVVDGIIGGVGGILVFLPNILLLFLGISILEGTGYMSRAAFLMDRVMFSVGLHGKSFIPLLIGFGCTVPAIMGTRTLENKNDRLVTMLVSPFMSCSARLPVYTLLISAFFDPTIAGTILFSIYVFGVIVAVIFAKIFRKTLFPGNTEPFIMEMPPYRLPTFQNIIMQMWERALLYLKKAATVILAASVLIWYLSNYPQGTAMEQSYAGLLGKFIEPLIKPLGFNWKIGIGIISGFSAKEVLVSTLGTIYSVGDIENSAQALAAALRADPAMSPLVALSLIFFVLLYTPCTATIAIIYRETGGWKWPMFTATYSLILAWLVSFIIFNVGKLLGF